MSDTNTTTRRCPQCPYKFEGPDNAFPASISGARYLKHCARCKAKSDAKYVKKQRKSPPPTQGTSNAPKRRGKAKTSHEGKTTWIELKNKLRAVSSSTCTLDYSIDISESGLELTGTPKEVADKLCIGLQKITGWRYM